MQISNTTDPAAVASATGTKNATSPVSGIRPLDATSSATDKETTPGVQVSLSPQGMKAAGKANASSNRHADIDESGLPDSVKMLLKRIRELREAIQEKAREMQAIMADRKLTEQQRKEAIQRLQTEVSALNGALITTNNRLLQVMNDEKLEGPDRMKAAELLMKP